jgi:hypothetical protein
VTPEVGREVAIRARIWKPEPVTAALLAHQGGWDEILMVLAPIVIFAGLLVVANRRAGSIEQERRRRDHDDAVDRVGRPTDGPAPR